MVEGLAKEVQKRMQSVGVKGSRVTLKVKQRKQDAKPPPKFLGHGSCHNLSKSGETIGSMPTNESSVILRIALNLLEQLNVPKDDIRGMGIVVSNLVDLNVTKDVDIEPSGTITSWFGNYVTQTADASARVDSSRRSLQESFYQAGETSGADRKTNDEVAVSGDALHADTPSDFLTRILPSTENPASIQVDESEPLKIASEAAVPSEEKSASSPVHGSDIVLSQLEQDYLSGDGSHCNGMDDEDIALPSFSQIHMSQVAELPSPMRKSIIARIESHETALDANHEDSAKAAYGTKSRIRVAAHHTDLPHIKDRGGMKQLSVKRMMKLAAVKSGADKTLSESLGGAVSLTQLECLPLEMQLQVANNEEIFSRYRSPRSARKKRRRSSPQPAKRSSSEASRARANGYQEETNGQRDVDEASELTQDKAPLALEQASFYQENIAPLKVFMDANPEAAGDASRKVQEFLSLCITERRFSDAVKILRSIKSREDSWSGNAYQQLVTAVSEQTRSALGRPLDLEGLGL